jgi:hypothetical protein
MLYDEYIGDIRSMSTDEMIGRKIERGKPLHVQGALGESGGPRKRMEAGQYVPDEEHAQICLNCTKKKCKGSCSLMSRTTTGRKRQKKEAVL